VDSNSKEVINMTSSLNVVYCRTRVKNETLTELNDDLDAN